MNPKHLTVLLALAAPTAMAESFEEQLARELAAGMDGRVEAVEFPAPPEYGTRTDVYLVEGGLEVHESMATGERDELRLFDEYGAQVRKGSAEPVKRPGLAPGLTRLWE